MITADLLHQISFWLLLAAMFLTCAHLYQGPMIMDRVNALNLLGNLAVGLLLLFGYQEANSLYLEIALVFCLVSFASIMVISRFLIQRYGK